MTTDELARHSQETYFLAFSGCLKPSFLPGSWPILLIWIFQSCIFLLILFLSSLPPLALFSPSIIDTTHCTFLEILPSTSVLSCSILFEAGLHSLIQAGLNYCVDQASFEFRNEPAYLCLPSAGIKGVSYQCCCQALLAFLQNTLMRVLVLPERLEHPSLTLTLA